MKAALIVPTTSPTTVADWLQLPQHWPAQGDLLGWSQTMAPGTAALLVILGIVYLVFGWYIFRSLLTLNATLLGAYLGAWAGHKGGQMVAGALIGGLIAAGITWPLMKYAVAVMGCIVGALVGASLWQSFGLDMHFAWAGGLSGLIFFGMLNFIIFRGSVMMYLSLQGSVMLVFGLLGLLYKYQSIAPQVTNSLTIKPFILPAAIFIPALFGLIYQQHNYSQVEAAGAKKK